MKGQTLIESLLALSVVGIILSGIAVIVASSLSNAGYGRDQSLATQYAQEGIEITRNTRNNNYAAFTGYSGNFCLSKGASTLPTSSPSCTIKNVDNFIRSVSIEQTPGCASSVAKATATVSWSDGKCSGGSFCHKSQITSCLSTANPVQGP